jgi:hypothetical protein
MDKTATVSSSHNTGARQRPAAEGPQRLKPYRNKIPSNRLPGAPTPGTPNDRRTTPVRAGPISRQKNPKVSLLVVTAIAVKPSRVSARPFEPDGKAIR